MKGIDATQTKYAGLSDLVFRSLPESTIEPLLSRLRLDDLCTTLEKIKHKQWLMSIRRYEMWLAKKSTSK